MAESTSWGPHQKRAALSITFDNLGESADVAVGAWPAGKPFGSHFTATDVVPKLIAALDGISVTYFVEGINATRYPNQLAAVRDAGHEIALHAWQHESWNRLRLSEHAELLTRSVEDMSKLGLRPTGFRPPRGQISTDALDLLAKHGFEYCSPVDGGKSRLDGSLVILPFKWIHVDAYLMDPALGSTRFLHGAQEQPCAATDWEQTLRNGLADAVEQASHLVVIFHPYMVGTYPTQWEVLRRFLAEVRHRSDLWLATCSEVARWIARPSAR